MDGKLTNSNSPTPTNLGGRIVYILFEIFLFLPLSNCCNSYCNWEIFMPSYMPISAVQMEQNLLLQINQWRIQHKLPSLKLNSQAQLLARSYSKDMAKRNFFSHRDPDGRRLDDRLAAARIDFHHAGENLAQIMSSEPKLKELVCEVIDGWLMSSGHRKNIENGIFQETGLGVFAQNQTFYITQIFLKK